ncbi:MAG: FG-GAP-like repeat-containing protein, partial [Rhodospirillales bacterium]|nr:FG-GAP-like repeat-containing protein [Rhodospirillales bacterium]
NDGGSFSKGTISAAAGGARFVSTVDIDGDGDLDVLSASVDDNTIAFYLNDGSGGFTRVVADRAAFGAYGAVPMDMDKNGLVDILGASKTDGTVSILFQEKTHDLSLEAGESLAIDTAFLNAIDPEQSPAALVYTILTAPTLGTLRLGTAILSIGETFTQADVDSGRISYNQTGAVEGSDSFRLSLSDGIASPSIASFQLTIGAPSPPGGIVSDDFSSGVLDPAWSIVGPAETSARMATTDGF